MRVCPTCGEVYSVAAERCPADGTALARWGGAISEGELGVYTDVDALASTGRQPAVQETPRVLVADLVARSSSPARGRVLGQRYRLDRSLGVGGYGAVFAAHDLHTGEAVAIKVLSPAVERSPEMLTRFHREAIAASRVRHPGIVDVVDFDVDDEGTQYIVMEFLDGHDLAQRLEDAGRLPPATALAIAAQCARGLAAAHHVGVLHRDLKPANVFLVRQRDGGERVKVIDFGISKLTRAAGDYTDVTRGSQVVGTPRYMPPEQARGEELDGRADVYALGVMMFEMLVGAPPFAGRSPLELFAQHVRATRQPPSARVPELAAS
ncbi:MAG: serine/threonine protein kinase, partial [Deltaproteobacteria bacterium]|nr:serine/threonine protein kinase [Kofleriaceae bacterium]